MDYRHQRRLKQWGSTTLLSQDAYPLTAAQLPNRGKVERIIHFTIEVIDENYHQHIPPLHDLDISQQSLQAANTEITELKQTIQQLEQKLNESRKYRNSDNCWHGRRLRLVVG